MPNRLPLVMIPLALALSGCPEDDPCAGAKCSAMDAGMMPTDQGSNPADLPTADTPPDTADDVAVSPDTATPDDMSVDIGADMLADMPPPVALPPATRFSFDIPFTPLGASTLGDGLLVVGNTPNDFEAGEDREAVALHTDTDSNIVWSARFGGTGNDQFFGAARRGDATVAAGLTRSYSVTAANNNDVLLVGADSTGLGEAFNWGTPDDELLFGLFDGGAVAEWIGVGEYTTDGQIRDGLVVAFDANLQPLWASVFDTGVDNYFSSGVVIGDTVYVVGSTGTRGVGGIRHGLVAAVTQTEVRWSHHSLLTSDAVGATAVGQQIAVVGRIFDGSQHSTLLRFETDGTYTGERFDVAGARIGTSLRVMNDGSEIVTGLMGQGVPYLMRLNPGAEHDLITFGDYVLAVGFLPPPIAETADGAHVYFERADETLFDIPFNSLPATGGCSTESLKVPVMPVPDGLYEPVTMTRTELTLTGGAIANPRTTSIGGTAETPAVCVLDD